MPEISTKKLFQSNKVRLTHPDFFFGECRFESDCVPEPFRPEDRVCK